MDPKLEAQKLGLITSPLTTLEAGWIQLDSSIDQCFKGVKEMRSAVTYLRPFLDHPFQVEALDNIDSLINEALIPYLAEVDKEYRELAPT